MKRAILLIWSLLILLPTASGQDYYRVIKHSRISTGLNEAGAIPYEDEGIVYITESTSVGASSPTDPMGRRLFTIFLLEKSGQKKHFREELVSRKHEGPVSFSGDFRTMVFSQQRPMTGSRVDPLGLFFAEKDEAGNWVNERAFEFNTPEAWLFSPSLSQDGRTLYFAANFQDSYGGFDIYRSKLKGGVWTKPENLGPNVNSEGHELYPFIHPMGRLYFSSDGRDEDKGGFDIFMTAYVQGSWAEAIKLTTPINSLSDDYQIWFSEDFKEGYLTSNRRSRSKEIFEIRTDIPEFATPEPIKKTYYKYQLVDRKMDTVDTELFRYSWVINDTLEVPGHDPIYEFPDTGFYHVVLHVYDLQLDTLLEPTTFKNLHIQLAEQPVIECPDTITAGIEVAFDATNSYLPGFDDNTYLWDFGDGTYDQGRLVAHTFLYPGRYKVTLGVQERKRNRRHTPEMRSSYKNVVVILPEQ
jgi:hypothetical protein